MMKLPLPSLKAAVCGLLIGSMLGLQPALAAPAELTAAIRNLGWAPSGAELALVDTLPRPPAPGAAEAAKSCTPSQAAFADDQAEAAWQRRRPARVLTVWGLAHFGARAAHGPRDQLCQDLGFLARQWQAALRKPATGALTKFEVDELARAISDIEWGRTPAFAGLPVGVAAGAAPQAAPVAAAPVPTPAPAPQAVLAAAPSPPPAAASPAPQPAAALPTPSAAPAASVGTSAAITSAAATPAAPDSPAAAPIDPAELQRQAEAGDAAAQSRWGLALVRGQGVAKNEAEAARWFRKAAEQGLDVAQFNLGLMLARGQGVVKDEAQAGEWFRKAAEQGYAAAQFRLGLMLAQGQGVAKDEAQAVRWYRKAADQGHETAQRNLAAMLANAQGATKNEAPAPQSANAIPIQIIGVTRMSEADRIAYFRYISKMSKEEWDRLSERQKRSIRLNNIIQANVLIYGVDSAAILRTIDQIILDADPSAEVDLLKAMYAGTQHDIESLVRGRLQVRNKKRDGP